MGRTKSGQAATTITITYCYDALYRLTNTTVYTYDLANRLTNVGPITYTWDNNGNLLSDGVYTYTYDTADRLITTTQGANTYTFAYTGMGDRVKQTANGVVTTYTLDLNAGLTQVLADGTNTYLYGLSRIGEQQPGGFAYHLPDALGSVRQLTNASGSVTLARSYEPYGNVMSSAGTGTTNYNFAGEWRDATTNLFYLRARYYSGTQGRFLTADSWLGEYTRPQSLNGFAYVEGNPINRVDPSGHCYGAAAFLRNIPGEATNCGNLDLALAIYGNPNATYLQKSGASAYLAAWGVGHVYLLVGIGLTGYAGADAILAWAGPYLATLPAQYPLLETAANVTAIGTEAYLVYRGLVCKDQDAAALLMTGYSLTSQSAIASVLSRAFNRLQTTLSRQAGIIPAEAEFATGGGGSATKPLADQLQAAMGPAQSGRVTMAVGLADSEGESVILIGTSEPNGYIRPSVRALVNALTARGAIVVPGTRHAEENIVNYAVKEELKLIEVSAGRPICEDCEALIRAAGAVPGSTTRSGTVP